ncbi:hypothetical protein N7486_010897 [Penicillium sp. IBT 16267x]|nr:hypothetical protein N7486_010897 [Penicillium sp. IBT 16267x]
MSQSMDQDPVDRANVVIFIVIQRSEIMNVIIVWLVFETLCVHDRDNSAKILEASRLTIKA